MNKYYLCIDLKTFYASVECVERKLNPFETDLIVADTSRSKNTICLAISPKMKQRGIKNRCRLYDIPYNVKPIIAKPRMKKYIEYSARIYAIYLKYVAKEDIHVYSIDEAFLDITSYLKLYQKEPIEIAKMIIEEIYDKTRITATAGIGTNLYLAKVALDILAKHNPANIAYLDINTYKEQLSHHTPLTDFWRIGKRTEERLNKLHLKNMSDIASCNEKILYKEFGKNALFLIEHAKGLEPCTIKEIKEYQPKNTSLSTGQILKEDYNYQKTRIVLTEMINDLTQELVSKKLYTDTVYIYIGYSKNLISPLKISKKYDHLTNNYSTIVKTILKEYDYQVNKKQLIRRINVAFLNTKTTKIEQLDIFTNQQFDEEAEKIEQTINKVQNKYGQNSLLRAISLKEGATQKERNKLIGGHNAE